MQAHAWTTDELPLLEAVAERTWDAVERARVEARLRAGVCLPVLLAGRCDSSERIAM